MRSLSSFLLLLVLGAWTALVQAQLGQAIAELPACATTCLFTAVPQSSCSLLDQACICANEPLQAEITLCVKAGCTAKEQLHTLRVTSSMCGHEVRDRRQPLPHRHRVQRAVAQRRRRVRDRRPKVAARAAGPRGRRHQVPALVQGVVCGTGGRGEAGPDAGPQAGFDASTSSTSGGDSLVARSFTSPEHGLAAPLAVSDGRLRQS
ncbi:hypothetical protein MCOR14_007344 [Pyricularia oryzae]|nr:hypothetical protein MCOR14_007344 [Pyricularia oryzae]